MKEIILNTSDKAAKFVENISGWVSRDGLFYGKDERSARYQGCTHVECEDCHEPAPKGRVVCDKCREKRDVSRYEKLEKGEWDEKGMLYSEVADRFFSSLDSVSDYLEEYNEEKHTPLSLRLVICEPVFLSQVDEDNWSDELAEDGELPCDVAIALAAFNAVIRKAGPVSWIPGNKAVVI